MLNTNNLFKYLRAPIDAFRGMGETIDTPHGPLIFQDNGAKVLAVAHLDTVLDAKPRWKGKGSKRRIVCPQLDDRLGAWVILDLLPRLGIKVDVLLTDSEEVGNSTAQYFPQTDYYNWAFSFDRAGLDVVMYDYETCAFRAILEGYGYNVGWGSFSDICSLRTGTACMNFGVGYHYQHSYRCCAKMSDTEYAVDMFREFHKDYKDTPMPHCPDPKRADCWAGYDCYEEYEHRSRYDCGTDDYEWASTKDGVEFGRINQRGDWEPAEYDSSHRPQTYAEWEHLATQYGYDDVEEFIIEWEEYEKTSQY